MQKIYQNNDSFRLRKAAGSDLAELKAMYGRIIEKMNADGIAIWDDFYPCELFENDIRDQRLYVLTDGGTIGNTAQSPPDGFALNLLAYFPSSCTEIP